MSRWNRSIRAGWCWDNVLVCFTCCLEKRRTKVLFRLTAVTSSVQSTWRCDHIKDVKVFSLKEWRDWLRMQRTFSFFWVVVFDVVSESKTFSFFSLFIREIRFCFHYFRFYVADDAYLVTAFTRLWLPFSILKKRFSWISNAFVHSKNWWLIFPHFCNVCHYRLILTEVCNPISRCQRISSTLNLAPSAIKFDHF